MIKGSAYGMITNRVYIQLKLNCVQGEQKPVYTLYA